MLKYINVTIDEFYKIKPDIYEMLSLMNKDALHDNYTLKNFFKDKPILISLIYKNDLPYEASTIISRPVFNNGCRVLNRLMVVPEKREKVPSFKIPETTLTMLRSQLNYVSNYYDYAFISREFNSYRFCKKFSKDCNRFLKYVWRYEVSRYLVCNWQKNWGHPPRSCFQWIAWTSFKEIDTLPLLSESLYQ